jgi:Protein of unknown function (DUF3891)
VITVITAFFILLLSIYLILQVDHSKVTGWLAAHWGNDTFAPPSPYPAMVLAAQEHDSGWWDWEIKPHLNDEGLPPDYIGASSTWAGGFGSTSTATALSAWLNKIHTPGISSHCIPTDC